MASIDLSRFHQSFFEESFENVQVMERLLLELDPAATDPDSINSIFRAAHSIKGGAGTFGFPSVAAFTHHLETLLDRIRAGKQALDAGLVDLLLRGTDAVQNLLCAARDGTPVDVDLIAELEKTLESVSQGRPAAAEEASAAAVEPVAEPVGFRVHFAPETGLFRSGNDPLRIVGALTGLGETKISLHAEHLPAFDELDPLDCHLSWDIELRGDVSEGEVRDVFAWVEDECRLDIEPITCVTMQTAEVKPEPVAAAPVAAPAAAPAKAAEPAAASNVTPIAAAAKPAPTAGAAPEISSIRVGTDKIDALINLVSELVITQAMLEEGSRGLDPMQHERLLNGLGQLATHTRLLQEAVMSTRMVPIEAVFSRFPRMLRDLAGRLGKDVRLQTLGEGTELDKSIIEKITDPLTHLVRNSIDHGIEPIEDRKAAGKPVQGTLTLRAENMGGQIVIYVIDDGRGLSRDKILSKARERGLTVSDTMTDSEVFQLIFMPGFSTAEKVTDVSGRGVGMDVVKQNIRSLGGEVDLSSKHGEGTTVTIRLPLTLAIVDGMSVAVGDEIFILPLGNVIESMQPLAEQVRPVGGAGQVVQVRNEYVPLVQLKDWFGVPNGRKTTADGIVVIVESDGRKLALLVDELVGQQQVVIKSLQSNYRRVAGMSGATILGDGRVALILDVPELVRTIMHRAAAA